MPKPVRPPAIIGMLINEVLPTEKTVPAPEPTNIRKQEASPVRHVLPSMPRKQPAAKDAPSIPAPLAPAPLPAPEAGGAQDDRPHEAPARAEAGGKSSGELTQPRSDALHLNNPKPDYPAISRRIGEEGHVRLSVYILADGRVGDIRLKQSSGYPRLDQAAIEAVRRWRYLPARRGDEPIDYWYVQTIIFSLNA